MPTASGTLTANGYSVPTFAIPPGHSATYALSVDDDEAFVGTVKVEAMRKAQGVGLPTVVTKTGTAGVPLTGAVAAGTYVNDGNDDVWLYLAVTGYAGDGINYTMTREPKTLREWLGVDGGLVLRLTDERVDVTELVASSGLFALGFEADGTKSKTLLDPEWLHINRTQDSPDASMGISWEAKGVAKFALGFDYASDELALYSFALPGDMWRVDPATGRMTFGAIVGTPTQEACQFIFKAPTDNDYIMGWRHGVANVMWLDKNGVLTIPNQAAATGTRYLVINTAGEVRSSASAPSGS